MTSRSRPGCLGSSHRPRASPRCEQEECCPDVGRSQERQRDMMALTFRSARSFAIALSFFLLPAAVRAEVVIEAYALPAGCGPHDVAPSPEPGGPVWYTAQQQGALGRLDPATGAVEQIPLGSGSAPHGVIVGPDGAPWITDSGLNAIVRVDPATREVQVFRLPEERRNVNLNTAAFDRNGRQAVVYQPERCPWPARPRNEGAARLGCAGGARTLRHHRYPGRRDLLRLSRRRPHRPH
jgi:hypothetical protein